MCNIYTILDDKVGQMRVFECAGRSFGVYVRATGHLPTLQIIDRASVQKPGLAPADKSLWEDAKQIAPELRDVLDQSQYTWDDPSYRELCSRLKLDPDHGRPVYAPAYEAIAARIVAIIDGDRKSPTGNPNLRHALSEILDLLVEDEPTKLTNACRVEFLPSAYGRSLRSDIAESWESSDCEPDGWSNSRYGHLAGIAYDFDTRTVWSRTVRRRLLAQGVLFLSKEVADQYLAGEGTHWRTVERKRGQTRIPSGGFFARLFQTETPLSDAAVITRHLARRAASDR